MTIVVGGMDIGIGLLVNLRKFIEEDCMVDLCSMGHCGALTHKHFQMVVKGNSSNLQVLNKKSKGLLGTSCESSDGSCCLLQEVEGKGFGHLLGHGWVLHGR